MALMDRVKNILLTPKTEWEVIDAEPATVAGLYSLYLLYLGLPVVMKSPKEKAMGYTAVVIIAAIVLFMVIGLAAGMVVSAPMALGR